MLKKIKNRYERACIKLETFKKDKELKIKLKDGFKFNYRVGTSDRIQLLGSLSEFFIPEYGIFHDDIIIDIGGYIGTFAIPASKKVKNGKIFSIEACKDTFTILKKNLKLNNIDNVIPFNIAISDSNKNSKLYYAPKGGSWGNSLTKNSSSGFEIVKSKTLKTFMNENKIPYCDFMKINCEGSEFEIILSSNKQTLQKVNTILILYHEDYNENHKKEELISHLKSNGFSIITRNQTKKRGWVIAKNRSNRK